MNELYIDGKKVVGGGSIRSVPCTGNFAGSNNIYYSVNNGICTISGWGLKCSASGGGLTVCTGLPPIKVPVGTYGNSYNHGFYYIDNGAPTTLKMHAAVTFTNSYMSMTYVVADNWVEPSN